MSYFLAIDAGGTKTDWLLADEGAALARARTGTVKRMRTDEATALANFGEGLRALEAASGVPMGKVTRTCIGAAGVSVPLVADSLRAMWSAEVGGALRLQGDVAIALDAAFHGGPGVLALAGTGSNVAGRAGDGTLHTCGGWGPVLADQGSGHAIGTAALRRAFLSLDERKPSALLSAICTFWRLETVEALIEFANSQPGPDVSRLTPLVVECASAGDAAAAEVLRLEGENLGKLVVLLLRHLQSLQREPTPCALAFAGSILQSVQPVRHALIQVVQQEFPECRALQGVIDPIDGALWRARDEAAFHAPLEWTS